MPELNFILLMSVLACIWVYVAAKNAANTPTRKKLLLSFTSFATALFLSAASLGSEWVTRSVAGNGFTEPSQSYREALAEPSITSVVNAYTAGILEMSFRHHRENAFVVTLASLLSLLAGIWSGHGRSRPPAQTSRSIGNTNAA